MLRDRFWRLVAARDDHEGNIAKRCDATRNRRSLFKRGQVTGHRLKAFRLTPQRLHDGVDVWWQLLHFANESLQCASGGRSKNTYHTSWNAWRSPGQEGKTRAHDSNSREDAANTREVNASPEQARLLSRDRLPLARWIEQHEAGDGGRTRRGVGANEQGTKRVADQHSWSCSRCVGQNAVQFAQHPRHGPRPSTGRAPAQPGAIVRTCAREGRDLGQHARPT